MQAFQNDSQVKERYIQRVVVACYESLIAGESVSVEDWRKARQLADAAYAYAYAAAAGKAHYRKMRDKLVELLQQAPVAIAV